MHISLNGRFLWRKLFIIPCLDSPCWQSHHVKQLKRPHWCGDVFSILFCPQKRKRKFIKTSKQILTRSETEGEIIIKKITFTTFIFLKLFQSETLQTRQQLLNIIWCKMIFFRIWILTLFSFLKRKYSNRGLFLTDLTDVIFVEESKRQNPMSGRTGEGVSQSRSWTLQPHEQR